MGLIILLKCEDQNRDSTNVIYLQGTAQVAVVLCAHYGRGCHVMSWSHLCIVSIHIARPGPDQSE